MSVDYYAYIESDAWKARRQRYFRVERHRYQCSGCKLRPKDKAGLVIHLHHLSYDNLGNEPERDLTPLCEDCHEIVHTLHREGGFASLRQATTFFKHTQKEGRKADRRNMPDKRGKIYLTPLRERVKHGN